MHYISSCASGRITRMLMADVGGLETIFSDVAVGMRDLMKKNINVIAQSSAVQEMGKHMRNTYEHGGFASTLLSTFFAPTRSFTVCNAGHPPPICYYASIDEWKVLKPEIPTADSASQRDFSGAILEDEFQKFRLTLDVGDMILSFSNALTECKLSNGATIGIDGLLKFAQRLSDRQLDEQALDQWISEIRDQHPGNLLDEDATIILNRATDSRVPMRDNLMALVRLLRKPLDRTTL